MRAPPALEVGLTLSEGAPGVNGIRLVSLLEFAAAVEGRSGEVGVWVCADGEIAELHWRFMEIPEPTDVLSFPGDPPYLGDIAVSYDTAAAQAGDVGHSLQREIAYLTLHGLLHLFGYDDLSPGDRERMIARQDELIARFETDTSDEWQ
jgi:probable rRNA maturation factor